MGSWSLFRRSVVPKVRCSEGPLFRRFVVPKVFSVNTTVNLVHIIFSVRAFLWCYDTIFVINQKINQHRFLNFWCVNDHYHHNHQVVTQNMWRSDKQHASTFLGSPYRIGFLTIDWSHTGLTLTSHWSHIFLLTTDWSHTGLTFFFLTTHWQ